MTPSEITKAQLLATVATREYSTVPIWHSRPTPEEHRWRYDSHPEAWSLGHRTAIKSDAEANFTPVYGMKSPHEG